MKIYKKVVIYFFYYSGLSFILRVINRKKIALIGFHSVGMENKDFLKRISISETEFKKRIFYLAKNYNCLSLEEFCEKIINNKSLPNYSAVIYFDDGYLDNLTKALPILKYYKIKATIFITTSCLKDGQAIFPVRLRYFLSKLSKNDLYDFLKIINIQQKNLDDKQEIIDEIVGALKNKKMFEINEIFKHLNFNRMDNGDLEIMITEKNLLENKNEKFLEFGSHSKNHLNLTNLSEDELKEEILESKNKLEDILGKEIKLFSVPSGRINDNVRDYILKTGYNYIVTTKRGLNLLSEIRNKKVFKKIHTTPDESFIIWKVRLSGLN